MKNVNRQAGGFSLVELVIVVVIVGLLAAIAIPRFSRGAAGATDSAVAGDLAVLRSAVEMYAAEHGGTYPAATTFGNQLTLYSSAAGATNASKTTTYAYGPYLLAVPALKDGTMVGQSGIKAVTTTPSGEDATATTSGWLYNETTGQVWANADDHVGR